MASPRVSGARLESLWLQAREPVFWLSAERKFLAVNRAWEELTGHSGAAVRGLVCRPHGPTRAGDLAGIGGSFYPPPEALAGQPVAASTLIVSADGERHWRRLCFWPFHDPDGQLSGLLGIVTPAETPPIVPDAESQWLRSQLLEVRVRLHDRYRFDTLIGQGPAHRRLLDQVSAAAATTVPVLIVGESGTGKRSVARAIHQQGHARGTPILPIDCAALPPEVLERELFGAGAEGGSRSRLNLPDGATLLIGDILELPRDLQSRLASSLDQRVRLIAYTSLEPDAALKAEKLRGDLYYTLTTMLVRLLPLRARLDELSLLAQHFLERANLRGARPHSGFTPEALAVLAAYDWPGNLRELARVIDEAHKVAGGEQIGPDDFPSAIRGNLAAAYNPPPSTNSPPPLDELLTQVERRLIENALRRARQNKSKAADLLGISRPRLYRRISELNLPDEADQTEPAAQTDHSPS
jgi:DNA-binding NtrC family response regulator